MQRVEKLIFAQADVTPDAIAVEHNGTRLTYRQLKNQALDISHELKNTGLKPGQTVAIFQHRSLTTLPLVLGIWEAGGVVIPINPATPPKLLESMIHDAAPRCMFSDSSVTPTANNLNGTKPVVLQPDDCYIIYTSGSEGRPKGVVGSHESLAHYLLWQAKEFSVQESDRFSQTAPLSFDFSLKELLVPLVSGARVCIADRNLVMDARKFASWVHESGITVMCCVPTLLRSILQLPNSPYDRDLFQSLRALLISGDMLRWDDVSSWRERFGNDIALFNLYGPTESTVIKLLYPIPETKSPGSTNVPVGRPIPESDVLVLDEDDQPCAPGEIGVVVILSQWLARGYLNGESDARFCTLEHEGQARRAYRTGDVGRWLSDGNLELMGRKDRQVKIRGYRIELDEVESILSTHAGLSDVAVIALNGTNNSNGAGDNHAVIACCFTSAESSVSEKEIRNFAKERLLPQVLSLTRFRRMDEFPLMPNGKVDRSKLQSLFDTEEEHQTNRLLTGFLTVQQRISAMWEELLALEGINPEANFFELGGDSMTAIRLLRKLREEVHPEVKLDDVYENPSIAQLSNRIEQLLA